jgi:hypothetical protein
MQTVIGLCGVEKCAWQGRYKGGYSPSLAQTLISVGKHGLNAGAMGKPGRRRRYLEARDRGITLRPASRS